MDAAGNVGANGVLTCMFFVLGRDVRIFLCHVAWGWAAWLLLAVALVNGGLEMLFRISLHCIEPNSERRQGFRVPYFHSDGCSERDCSSSSGHKTLCDAHRAQGSAQATKEKASETMQQTKEALQQTGQKAKVRQTLRLLWSTACTCCYPPSIWK